MLKLGDFVEKEGDTGEVIGFTRNGFVKCSFGSNRVMVLDSKTIIKLDENSKDSDSQTRDRFVSREAPWLLNHHNKTMDEFELSYSSTSASIENRASFDFGYVPFQPHNSNNSFIRNHNNVYSSHSKKNVHKEHRNHKRVRQRPKSLESVFDVQHHDQYHQDQHHHRIYPHRRQYQSSPPISPSSSSSPFFGTTEEDEEIHKCSTTNNINGAGGGGHMGNVILTGKSPRGQGKREVIRDEHQKQQQRDRRIRSLDSVNSSKSHRKVYHKTDHSSSSSSSSSLTSLAPAVTTRTPSSFSSPTRKNISSLSTPPSPSSPSSLPIVPLRKYKSQSETCSDRTNYYEHMPKTSFRQNFDDEDEATNHISSLDHHVRNDLELGMIDHVDISDTHKTSPSRLRELGTLQSSQLEEGGENGVTVASDLFRVESEEVNDNSENDDNDDAIEDEEEEEEEWWERSNHDYDEEHEERRVRIGVDLGSLLGMHLGEQTLKVYNVLSNSQAEAAGVCQGWRLVKVGSHKVSCLENFKEVVMKLRSDAENEFSTIRQLHRSHSNESNNSNHSSNNGSSSLLQEVDDGTSDCSSVLIVEMLEFIVSIASSSSSLSSSSHHHRRRDTDDEYASDYDVSNDSFEDDDDEIENDENLRRNPMLIQRHDSLTSNSTILNIRDHDEDDSEEVQEEIIETFRSVNIQSNDSDDDDEEEEEEGEDQSIEEVVNRRVDQKEDPSHHKHYSDGDCSICLECLSLEVSSRLPCGHYFHRECIAGLRSFGVNMVCPLCRISLPPGPNQLFDDATWRYFVLKRRVNRGEASFDNLKPDEERVMTQVVSMWTDAAEEGHPGAQYNLGCVFERGRFVAQSHERAAALYKKAAIQQFAQAQFSLGFLYEQGRGVGKNDALAAKWYRKAAKLHDPKAQCNLGVLYDQGRGVQQSDFEALHYYWSAANQNVPDAQFNLGNMYSKGRGVPQSDVKAFKWFKKAALALHVAAQYNLAVMIEHGRGCDLISPNNDIEAFYWYAKAAEGNHDSAQNNLGLCYEYGRGCELNEFKAFQWYYKSSKSNNARGQYNLGYMYEKGRGCDKSLKNALIWYSKAASQGEEHAKVAMEELLEQSKDSFRKKK